MEENNIQIPDGWEKEVLLADLIINNIIKLDRGRVISSIDLVKTPGDYPVYSSSAQKNGFFGAYGLYDFDEELITWSVDGGGYFFYRPKHKFSVTNVSGILSILDKAKFDYKFLYYLLAYQHSKEVFDYVDKAHPSVIKNRYLIPEIDLTEQKKIAEILSKVDKAIEQTERLIAKYQRIKTGLMQDLLTKGIDENGKIRSEETHEFKDSPLGRIPVEWEVEKLETLYKNPIRDFGSFSSTSLITFLDEGVPFIKSEMIEEDNIKWDNVFYISHKVHKLLTKSYVLKGNILFSKIGSALGKAVIYNLDYSYCNSNAAIAKISIDNQKANPKYITNYLNSFMAKKQFAYMIVSLLPRINLGDINQLLIPLMSIEEQKQGVKMIDKIKMMISDTQMELQKLQHIKTALMQDLLSGKKRVTNLIKVMQL